jgi:GAF domain-containing protein
LVRSERSSSQRGPRSLVRFLRAASTLTSRQSLPRALRPIAVELATLCRADRCSILAWRDPTFVTLASRPARSGEGRARSIGPLACRADAVPALLRVVRERRTVIVSQPAAESWSPADWRAAFNGGPLVVVPLHHDERLLGAVVLDNSATRRPLTTIRRSLAETVAAPLALALDHAQLVAEMRYLSRETETLLNVGTTVASSLELSELVRRITREAARAVGADSAGIYVARDGVLEPLAAYHLPKGLVDDLRRQPLIVQKMQALLDVPRWSDDVPHDPAFRSPIFERFPMRSLVMVPLEVKKSRVGLLVCAWWTERRSGTVDEMRLLEAIAGQAAVAIEAARLAAQAEQAAVGRERMRMDGLLHDTLSSTLFALALKLDACLHRSDCSADLRARLESMKQHAKTMMIQIRGLVAPGAV